MVHGFFVDMNEIFEEFVAKLFAEFYAYKYKVESQKTKKAWIIDGQSSKNIRTDILLADKQTGKQIVIDTKYKPKVYDSDLYQIGFYVHEHSPPGRAGTKTGYVVLPTAEREQEKQKHVFTSRVQNIQIVQSYLNLDHIVPLLSNRKLNYKIIQSYLSSLLEF